MNFVCDVSVLKNALFSLEKIVPTKSTIPVLEGILFVAKNDELTLSASNINTYLEVKTKATIKEEAAFVLEKQIFSIVNTFGDGVVEFTFSQERGIVTVVYETSKYDLLYFNDSDFPRKSFEEKENKFTVKKGEFIDAVNRTVFAASTDEGRGIIVGEKIEVKDGAIKYIAIDGYRIATNKKETEATDEMEFVVHAKDLRELTRIFEKDEAEELKITADKNEILILGNDIKTKTKLLEGEYIKYEAIIPTEKKIKIKIEKAKFYEALQRVSSIIKEKGSSYVKILFGGGEAELVVEKEGQKADTKFSVEKDGEDIIVGLSIKYLEEIISAIKDEEFLLSITDSSAPCLFSPLEGENFQYVLLPIKL